MEIITQSARETQKLGEKLAADLISGKLNARVLCLSGDLGSGKTTFVQGLAQGLGIKKRIISPTFIFIRPYTLAPSRYTLYHVDLYRIEKLKEVEGLGFEEILSDPANIVAIEWAEKIEKILLPKRIDVYFEYVSEGERKIIIKEVCYHDSNH